MRGLYNAFYVINIVFQAIFTLLFNIGIALLASWLLVSKCNLPNWVYVPFILVGAVSGIFSMVKFILSAMTSLESLENNQNDKRRKNEKNK